MFLGGSAEVAYSPVWCSAILMGLFSVDKSACVLYSCEYTVYIRYGETTFQINYQNDLCIKSVPKNFTRLTPHHDYLYNLASIEACQLVVRLDNTAA